MCKVQGERLCTLHASFFLAIENTECYSKSIMRLLTPKLDFVFKKLFAGDTGVLLNSVLKLSGRRRIVLSG